jgi:hypothetical protein
VVYDCRAFIPYNHHISKKESIGHDSNEEANKKYGNVFEGKVILSV